MDELKENPGACEKKGSPGDRTLADQGGGALYIIFLFSSKENKIIEITYFKKGHCQSVFRSGSALCDTSWIRIRKKDANVHPGGKEVKVLFFISRRNIQFYSILLYSKPRYNQTDS